MRTRDILDVLLTTAAVLAFLQHKLQLSKPTQHPISITMHRVAVLLLTAAATCAVAAPMATIPDIEDAKPINLGVLPVIVPESATPTGAAPAPTFTPSLIYLLDSILPLVPGSPTATSAALSPTFTPTLPRLLNSTLRAGMPETLAVRSEKYVVTEGTPALPVLKDGFSRYVVSEGMPALKSVPIGTVRVAEQED